MKLTILGSSSALPTSERNPSAHVLNAHERLFLIDCGEGTQLQMRRSRIRFGKINHIFISHLHGDHVFGLYGLLSSFSLMGRKTPLHLYAPGNYQNILLSHLNDFDIHLGFEIEFKALAGDDPVQILDDKYITVTSIPLRHRIPTYGFIFREKRGLLNIKKELIDLYNIPHVRIPAIKMGEDFITPEGEIIKNDTLTLPPVPTLSYAYCSDTMYFSRLASFVRGVDLLYHEATFDKEHSVLARTTGHSTTLDAARTAADADVKALIIGHFSSRYRDIMPLVEETRSVFPNSFPAIDGNCYDVGNVV